MMQEKDKMQERNNKMENIFTDIYTKKSWGGKESISGRGSDLDHTHFIIDVLPEFFRKYNIKRLVDIPCGDMNWMNKIIHKWSIEEYIGMYIVDEIISNNVKQFGQPQITFQKADITKDLIPTSDLIFVRDCFIHFSFEDIFHAIENLKSSGSKYLLMTNGLMVTENEDISTGQGRYLNFQHSPFNFPKPLESIVEKSPDKTLYNNKSLSLWKLEDIKIDAVEYYQNVLKIIRKKQQVKMRMLNETPLSEILKIKFKKLFPSLITP